MDSTNEEKDKSRSNKPPLLPKPCLSSSGAGDHIIPQMVITSADDVPKISISSDVETLPSEAEASEVVKDVVQQSEGTMKEHRREKEMEERVPTKTKTKVEDPAAHSAVQRPLVFDPEKSGTSQASVETNPPEPPPPPPQVLPATPPSSALPPTPPPAALPPTTMQRPLGFSNSSQRPESISSQEEKFEECSSELFSSENVNPGNEVSNIEETGSTPGSKPKSSSFSWIPSLPKLHPSGKEEKPSASTTIQGTVDDKQLHSQEPHSPKNEGLQNVKKFFGNLVHDSSGEPKDKKVLPTEKPQISTESKKSHKDGKQGLKKLFSASKSESETKDKTSKSQKEIQKETEKIPKETHKEEKHGIKKIFSSKPEPKKPAKDSSTKTEFQKDDEVIEKDHPKEGKYNLKRMLDSFKHDTVDNKPSSSKDDVEISSNEKQPKPPKESTPGVKKFFNTFKHSDTSGPSKIPKIKISNKTEKDSGNEFQPLNLPNEKQPSSEISSPAIIVAGVKDVPQNVNTDPKKSVSTKPKPGEKRVKKFFSSFQQDGSSKHKEDPGKPHVTFTDLEPGLKRSLSFKESLLIKDSLEKENADKQGQHGFKKFFSSGKGDEKDGVEGTSRQVKRSHSWRETPAEKEASHGIRSFFDSFSHKIPKESSQRTLSSGNKDEEHIYDTVGKPVQSSSGQVPVKDVPKKPKDGDSGMKKLFDSFLHKEATPKQSNVKGEKKGKRPYEKVDISSAIPKSIEAGRTFEDMKKERAAKSEKKDSVSEIEKKEPAVEVVKREIPTTSKEEVPKLILNPPLEATLQPQQITVPSATVNGPSTSTDTKTSVFHSISDNFTALKDKMLHSKEKKPEVVVNHDKHYEEYDLSTAAQERDFVNSSVGTYKTFEEHSYINQDVVNKAEDKRTTSLSSYEVSKSKLENTSSQKSTINQPKVVSDLKTSTKTEPGTPDTLYDTCCMRIAVLLGKKAIEIVSDQTKTPPKKPPKPSAEAIAKARAEVVSKRLRELKNAKQGIGENIPVGYDGIHYVDDETESSCDYKDVENFDYIMDYELVNRYKFDSKVDSFSAQSTCSVSSYYTADTVTLKDETFSDAPLETISLGSNDSHLFQHLSSPTLDKPDFNSLPSNTKNQQKLKQFGNQNTISSTETGKTIKSLHGKKVPPPIPPKPNILPKTKVTQYDPPLNGTVSQCINGLSLSPRLQTKFPKDAAATRNRPLLVAGLRKTDFSSLKAKNKDSTRRLPKENPFNTVLRNESLKKIGTISPLHRPLKATQSSPPQLFEPRVTPKPSPQRPPPPAAAAHLEGKNVSIIIVPPATEKPNHESRVDSPHISAEKRTISPPRPPPPMIARISSPPPRPPPPAKSIAKEFTYQNIENNLQRTSSEQLDQEVSTTQNDMPRPHAAPRLTKSENLSTNDDLLQKCSVEIHDPEPLKKTVEFMGLPETKSDFPADVSLHEPTNITPAVSPSSVPFCETDDTSSPVLSYELQKSTPKPPPRSRRIRSRTVEIAPKEKEVEPVLRRSQSLSDIDIQKRVTNLNIPSTSDKADVKHLYTAVNKNGKKNNSSGSSSPRLGDRPLPAPPPPPRKFRSLDRKPKEKQPEAESDASSQKEKEFFTANSSPQDLSIKPPERKKKTDKQHFLSLSVERKKVSSELIPESSRIPRSNSVPLKPGRKCRHTNPEYDENANVAISTVAEIHQPAVLLDECGNEILEPLSECISNKDTTDQTDSVNPGNLSANIKPHPRLRKDKNPNKKSHSSWYDEKLPNEESWEILDWDPSGFSNQLKGADVSKTRRPTRRQSDPLAGRSVHRTSTFYVNVDQVSEVSHIDKETSPLHLNCSEKSVQTSLETLSQGIASQDEKSEHSESSENTDNLLNMVKTLQSELKTTLNRHKLMEDEDNDSSSNAPTDSERGDEPGKQLLQTPSIRSSTSDLYPLTSSEESEAEIGEDEERNLSEIALRRKRKKIFFIAQEIMTSEEKFVDTLKLLNVDFKAAVETANRQRSSPVVPEEVLSQILNHLPQLQHLNENLLMELKDRIDNWDKLEKIADVIVKMGPFLKLYSWYIHDFECNLTLLEESKRKYPLFAQVVREFETSARCERLFLNHFMLKPIQRIPQYRLLLQEYLHQLSEESPDYPDTIAALQIVSEVANHANDSMKQGDNAQKLISIQNSIMGHKEIIKPGRLFVKEGELMKLSRKGMQPRWFVLFNDLLLYLTPVQHGLYRINHELPLTGMKVAIPIQQDYQNEFSIISVARSFSLAARSPEERQEWIVALTKAIEENASKRSTFTNVRLQQTVKGKSSEDDGEGFVLGRKAPVWIPDARVTMCQLCTSEFTVTFRRHHCRACGKVSCSICSSNRIPLAYLGGNKLNRVCDECYSKLGPGASCPESAETDSDNQQIAVKPHLRTEHRHVKKGKRNLPSVLKEVCANDQGSTISGYLQKRTGKNWKRDWFVVKDKVLYEYRASEDVAALRSIPLLGYEIELFSEGYEGVDSSLLFQLTHPGQAPIVFHADSVGSTERWIAALKEASVLE